jgi:AraC-like DNA-binding protein
MALLIDTAVVPAHERLDYWWEESCDAYHPLQIQSAARERFFAQMWAHELGPLSFFRIAAAPNTMVRTSRAIAASDPECLHVSIVQRGRLDTAQEGRCAVAYAGDLVSYETSHPVLVRAAAPFEVLVTRVPRDLLGRDVEQIARCTAVTMPGGEGMTRAVVAFLRGLFSGLEDGTISSEDAPAAVDCVIDLVRGLHAQPDCAEKPTKLRSRAEIMLNIKSYIEANLGDPDLGPDEIARASFISTRYLHKLFQLEGMSVCRWIRAARLDRCRRDLVDPALRSRTILEIASHWGLTGPQHFSRLFRSAYGCSPSDYRRNGNGELRPAVSPPGLVGVSAFSAPCA